MKQKYCCIEHQTAHKEQRKEQRRHAEYARYRDLKVECQECGGWYSTPRKLCEHVRNIHHLSKYEYLLKHNYPIPKHLKRKRNRKRTVTCKVCHHRFGTRNTMAKYCSKACKREHAHRVLMASRGDIEYADI
jgi:hypothetical protein